ncbi:MAG: NAD(P)/FAD-dependent oxidoreductase [Acidimicrobiales bacterium]
MAQDRVGMHHKVLIIGGGTAGITVAARLRRAGQDDVALIEPSPSHYYQPLWTLVGGGAASARETVRSEAGVMPRGVRWLQDRVVEIDPDKRTVAISSGAEVGYDFLVVCPGIQLDWDKVIGLPDGLGRNGISSNYDFELAPRTWELVKSFRGGTALFTMPGSPIKCAGAPQKIAYLAADYWRKQGVLHNSKVIFATGTPGIFSVKEYADILVTVIERYGIDARVATELVEVDPAKKEAVLETKGANGPERTTVPYDMLHVAPPQSAPDFIKKGPLADPANPLGWVQADKHTLQHPKYPTVFAIGDASSLPTSKTGAAIRKQAPVLVQNLLGLMAGRDPASSYDGYTSCPLVTAKGKMLLAEFDYSLKPHPTIPIIDTEKERYDMWLLKRYGLPFMYWNLMLKGLV